MNLKCQWRNYLKTKRRRLKTQEKRQKKRKGYNKKLRPLRKNSKRRLKDLGKNKKKMQKLPNVWSLRLNNDARRRKCLKLCPRPNQCKSPPPSLKILYAKKKSSQSKKSKFSRATRKSKVMLEWSSTTMTRTKKLSSRSKTCNTVFSRKRLQKRPRSDRV